MSSDLPDPRLPQIGEILDCKGNKLQVVELLASGPFSEVYKLRDVEHVDKYYAMKLEKRDNERFTKSTTIRIAIQTLDRIEALHKCGFISRDIKASNFAIGVDKNDPNIYMFDFGLSRRYRDANGEILPPRKMGGLLGTVLYAPLATHEMKDQCRRDDLESWFYMCVEMFSGYLPWEGVAQHAFAHHNMIADWKRFCQGPGRETFLQECPPEFGGIFDMINSIGYYQEPDYWRIRSELEKVANQLDMQMPFDWNLNSDILERSELVGDVGETRFASQKLNMRRMETITAAQSITCRENTELEQGSSSPILEAADGGLSNVDLFTPPVDE